MTVGGRLYKQVAAGNSHSIALTTDGTVWAWGNNEHGQLGDGTTTTASTPVQVHLPTGLAITDVAAGAFHSVAVASDGTVWAWGNDADGELGNGSTTDSPTPVEVQMPSDLGIVKVSAGDAHTVAVAKNGSVWAWGSNAFGQLGDGRTGDSSAPVEVLPPSQRFFTTVAAGADGSAAVASDGTVWAWGYNDDGELGDGTTTESPTPVQVQIPDGQKITQVGAGGFHFLALTAEGTVWAWGYNDDGELGDGTTTNSLTPEEVPVPKGHRIAEVGAGAYHSLAVASDGSLWAWGYNDDGELGDGTTTGSLSPLRVQVPGGRSLAQVAGGNSHSLAVTADGSALAWGDNSGSQLGDGSHSTRFRPGEVGPAFAVDAVAVGGAPAPRFTYDHGILTFVTPAHAAGVVDVVLQTNQGVRVLPQAFSFVTVPAAPEGPTGTPAPQPAPGIGSSPVQDVSGTGTSSATARLAATGPDLNVALWAAVGIMLAGLGVSLTIGSRRVHRRRRPSS